MDSTEIIKKILSHDNLIYLKLPKKIIKEYLVNFKKSNNIEKNKNSKINIIKLSEYMKLDKIKIVKLLYFNIDSFHHALYEYNTEIILEEEEKNLSYIFYAALLIKDNPNIINYSFTIKLIQGIHNKMNENYKNKKNIYSNLMLSKALFDLIDAYKGLDEYYNKVKEIQEIETNNINIMENLIQNINNNNELKLNFTLSYIKSKTIDQIYIDIIIDFLKNKSEDYSYISNIIKEMELESINITEKMFEEINKFLDDEKNGIMDKYLISKHEDLFNENKINFSYILLFFILKNSIFIYQIKFFVKERNNLLKLYKPNSNIFSNPKSKNTDQQIVNKLNYILIMLNLEYYSNKNKDINLRENNLSNNSTEIDSPNSNNKNIKTDTIKRVSLAAIYDSTNSNQSTLMNSSVKNNSKLESNKNNAKTNNYFNKSKISTKNIVCENSLIIDSSFKYNFIYKKIGEHTFSSKDKNSTAEFITEIQNIFISFGTNNELNIYNDSYEKISTCPTEDWIYNVLYYNNKTNNTTGFAASSKKKIYIFSEEKNKSIYKTSESPTDNNLLYLFSMENNYYFSCCENTIFLYGSLFDKLQNQPKFTVYENKLMRSAIKIDNNFVAFKSNKISSKGVTQLLLFNFTKKKDTPEFLKKEEEYSFIFSPLGQALIIHKSHDKNANKDIENRILLFACKKYIKSQKNGIFAIYNMNDLLESQNNISDYDKADSYFYNTDNFNPYCICPLSVNESKNILEVSLETKETNYFLVGGFEKKRNEGIIKLYKIIYEIDEKQFSKLSKFSIEYIQDIKIFDKDFRGFKGPISCIIQSKKDGKVLITCWDGNIYLVYNLETSYYLNQDKEIKKPAIEFFSREKDDNWGRASSNVEI